MNPPVISVIIPVFNAQNSLPAAIDSVLRQDIEDFEIILVNDGSRDDSLRVCEQYAQNDPRIKVIDQANGGPSTARNAGIREATGRYLAFVDSDDTLTPGAYARMLDAALTSGAQIVIAHFNFLIGDKALDSGRAGQDMVLDRDAFMGAFIKKPASFFFACVWNKLYSCAMVKDNGIFFDSAITWGEDLYFNMLCCYHVNKAAFLKQPVYNYRLTGSGQALRSFFRRPAHVLQVRRLQYHTLKDLYLHTGYYRRYRARIHWFLFDIFV